MWDPYKKKNLHKEKTVFKARFLYCLAVVLSVVFIFTLYHRMTVVVLCVILAMPVASYLFALAGAALLRYDVISDTKVFEKGQRAAVAIQVSNESPLVIPFARLLVRQIDPNGRNITERMFAFSLFPFKSVRFESDSHFSRRGAFETGICSVELYDILGLFRVKRDIGSFEELTVLPRRVLLMSSVADTIPDEDGDERRANDAPVDHGTLSHAREYAEGDMVRNIHWKLSSKLDDLYVKVYNHPNDTAVVIFADMQAGISSDPDVIEDGGDAVVEAALTLALRCVTDGKGCLLIWYDTFHREIMRYEISNMDDFNAVFSRFALTPVSFDGVRIGDLADEYTVSDIGDKSVFFVTQRITFEDANVIGDVAHCTAGGVSLVCFDFEGDETARDITEQLGSQGVRALRCEENDVENQLNAFISNAYS